MKALLFGTSVLALGIFLWAAIMAVERFRRRKIVSRQEPSLQVLEGLMRMQGGSIQPSHIAGMTHAMAECLLNLSRRIDDSSQSTERLATINVLLVSVIAVATVAYTVAAWLQLK